MAKQIKLSVAVPCHENWENMSPVDKGKFCGSCQKQVVDFSTMSDRQVAEFFKKPSTGSVCGRFMTDQLDRNIEIPRKRIPWLKYFFQIAIPAFLFSYKGTAQGKVIVKTETKAADICTQPTMGIIALPFQEKPTQITTMINGRVVDEEGNPVSFASIYIKGTKTGTAAGEDGSFQLKMNKGWDSLVLSISCIGFESREYPIRNNKAGEEYRLVIAPVTRVLMGEVVAVSSMIMGNIGMVICRSVERTTSTADTSQTVSEQLMNKQIPIEGNNTIRIFPNPVQAGSTIKIAFQKSQPGKYRVQFIDMSGRIVHEGELVVERGATEQEVNVPVVVPGTYIMDIVNSDSKKTFSQKVIIR